MPPSHRAQPPSSSPPSSDMAWQENQTPRKPSPTTTTTKTSPRSPRSPRSSIPTLPDVGHKAPSAGSQGNLLHTLLMEEKLEKDQENGQEEKEEKEEESVQAQENKAEGASSKRGSISGRTVSTKKKGKAASQEGQGRRQSTTTDDRASKSLTTETLTTPWPGAAHSSPKGQRRRRSRDNGPSGRRLSGPPLPTKKKAKRRLSQGSDPLQLPASHRRFSSPVATALARSSKLLDLSLKMESDLILRNKLEEETCVENEADSTVLPTHGTEELVSESGQILPASDNSRKDSSESENSTDSRNLLSDIDEGGSDFTKVLSDPKEVQTGQSGHSRLAQTPAFSATDRAPLTSGSSQVRATTPSISSTPWPQQDPVPAIRVSENKTPTPAEPSDPFSQWTTCRALEDSDDESDIESDHDDNDNISRGPSRMSEVDSHDFHNFDHSKYPFNDLFNRVGSSMRRKRPLLLPPIMLPPLHTVKPTPLVYRDEMHYTSVTPRARRSLSEAEWEKLRDCRYLRIPPWRRSLEV